MDFLGGLLSASGGVAIVRAVAGGILVFFLPGFAWSLVILKGINTVERVALSVGLSIALVTLSVIALNVAFDVRINGTNALFTIIALTIIPLGIYFFKRYRSRRSSAADGE